MLQTYMYILNYYLKGKCQSYFPSKVLSQVEFEDLLIVSHLMG